MNEAEQKTFTGQIILFTSTRTVLHTAYRMVYPFLSVFARGLGIDLITISLVMTGRSLMGLFGPLLAPIADIRGRKVSMLLGLGLFIFSAVLISIFPTFPVFVFGLVLSALSILIFLPAMQAYIGDRVPYNRRGRALGITELSWSLSFIAGVPLVGWLIDTLSRNPETALLSWRAPFPLLAILGLIFFILIAVRIPNNRSSHPALGNSWQTIRQILKVPTVLAGLGFAIATCVANETVNLVFGVWLEDSFSLQLAALGAASAVIGISELSGEGLSAFLSDRIGKELAVRIGLITSALASVLIYLIGSSIPGALIGLFLFYLGFEFTIVSSLPLMSEVYPAARATVMASTVACFSLGRALGAFLAPYLYQHGFIYNLIVALISIAIAFYLLRTVHPLEEINADQQIPLAT